MIHALIKYNIIKYNFKVCRRIWWQCVAGSWNIKIQGMAIAIPTIPLSQLLWAISKIFLVGPQNTLEKRAGRLVASCIASLPALAGNLQTHFSRAFWGPTKKIVGCSQRLTLKNFTMAKNDGVPLAYCMTEAWHYHCISSVFICWSHIIPEVTYNMNFTQN